MPLTLSTVWTKQANQCSGLHILKSGNKAGARIESLAAWLTIDDPECREHHQDGIKEVVKPFDWSYSTDYKGTVSQEGPQFIQSPTPIPLELLRQPDPIQFFDEVMLYEDELADNGITILNAKVRVMPSRMLLLCRFFMRLDDVMFRIRDTRVFVEFGTGEVIREYTSREESFQTVRLKLASTREDVPALMRDPNRLAEVLPIVEKTNERLLLR